MTARECHGMKRYKQSGNGTRPDTLIKEKKKENVQSNRRGNICGQEFCTKPNGNKTESLYTKRHSKCGSLNT
jgi:hypothetical protein